MESKLAVDAIGRSVLVRPLRSEDRAGGIFGLLSQLTEAPSLPQSEYDVLMATMQINPDQLVIVIEDTAYPRTLLGTGSVLVHQKLVRAAGRLAHVEDVVVASSARGRGIGKLLVHFLLIFARSRGCYKANLNCTLDLIPFYERCGLQREGNQMALDLIRSKVEWS